MHPGWARHEGRRSGSPETGPGNSLSTNTCQLGLGVIRSFCPRQLDSVVCTPKHQNTFFIFLNLKNVENLETFVFRKNVQISALSRSSTWLFFLTFQEPWTVTSLPDSLTCCPPAASGWSVPLRGTQNPVHPHWAPEAPKFPHDPLQVLDQVTKQREKPTLNGFKTL